jgi:hypothetical protein
MTGAKSQIVNREPERLDCQPSNDQEPADATLVNARSPFPLDSFPYIYGNWSVILRQPIVHHSLNAGVEQGD